MNAPAVLSPPARGPAQGTNIEQQTDYADDLKGLLFALLRKVVARRAPGALAAFDGPETVGGLAKSDLISALQASGIWFQLAGIAEENALMRARRDTTPRKRPNKRSLISSA